MARTVLQKQESGVMGPSGILKAPAGELQSITGSPCSTWGGRTSGPECHKLRVAGIDSFFSVWTGGDGQPILPDYAFAICLPNKWPFGHVMDPNILPDSYVPADSEPTGEGSQGDPDNTRPSEAPTALARKHHNHRARARTGTDPEALVVLVVPQRPVLGGLAGHRALGLT